MNPVEDIKAKLPLEDLIGESVALKPAGRDKLKGLCPFHNEKTPSFQVDTRLGLYHCFSCKKSGDVFTFVQDTQGLDFNEAKELLAQRTGVTLPERLERRATKGLADLQRFAQEHFLGGLSNNPEAQAYLKHRGFTPATVELWGFGFAPGGRHGLLERARENGITEAALIDAGLAKRLENGRTVEMFRDRLTIPILDAFGRIVGFTARTLKDGVQPKYLNTPETELFKKGDILFGLAHARGKIRDSKAAVVVEGQLDVVACHQAGIGTVVGAQSSTLTDAQVSALDRLGVERLYFAYDPDEAGQKATLRGLDTVARRFKVFVARLPGEDPADLVRRDLAAFRKVLRHAVPELEFRVARAWGDLDQDHPQDRQKILERLKDGMKDLREPYDPVAFELRSAVAERLGMSEKKLKAWANSGPKTRAPGVTNATRQQLDVRHEIVAISLADPARLAENLDRIEGVADETDQVLKDFLEMSRQAVCDVEQIKRAYSERDDAAPVFALLMDLQIDERRDLLGMALNKYLREMLPNKDTLRQKLAQNLQALNSPTLTESEIERHRTAVAEVAQQIALRLAVT